MKLLDEARDEIQLSRPIVEGLAGRFRLTGSPGLGSDAPALVNVQATNGQLALSGRRLDEFVAVPPSDPRVIYAESEPIAASRIDPTKIALLLLCGGLSFRTHGKIHPLMPLQDPQTGRNRTLLDRQLDRLFESPLGTANCVIVATPLNEGDLRHHLEGLLSERRLRVCVGGLAPRLSPVQHTSGSPLLMHDPSGEISYNPVGHLEALRWFVLSGMLAEFADAQVIIIASYSNWGRIFNQETIDIAGTLARTAQTDEGVLFFVEVTRSEMNKERGSILVATDVSPGDLRLVKDSYGQGRPRLAQGDSILLSTNTLHFSIPNLLERLRKASPSVDLPDTSDAIIQLLRNAAEGRRRDQLSRLFETTFPVEPYLIPVPADGTPEFLRVERDLDQLTLIPGPSPMKAVEVNPHRGVFLKLPSDFENSAKLAFVFNHEPK
jgi:hypothetical protein